MLTVFCAKPEQVVSAEGLGKKPKPWHKPDMRPAQHYAIVCLLCSLTPLVNAQPRNSDNEKVLALEKKWTEAYKRREISILTSLLADDFIITVEDGSTYGKEGYIAHSADPSVHVEIAEQTDLRVRTRDNVAVVTGAYYERGKAKGKAYEYRDRLTDVWLNVEGKWQVIASHYSVPLNQ